MAAADGSSSSLQYCCKAASAGAGAGAASGAADAILLQSCLGNTALLSCWCNSAAGGSGGDAVLQCCFDAGAGAGAGAGAMLF
jgi:hypothetical protein